MCARACVSVCVCARVCRLTFATSKDQATATRFPLREAVLEQRSWFTRTGHIEYANGLSTRHSCVKHARREHTHTLSLSKGRYLPLRFPLERNGTGGYRLAFQKLRAFFFFPFISPLRFEVIIDGQATVAGYNKAEAISSQT